MSMLFKRIKDWATSITAFRAGDVIPVDGPSGTAKMNKDALLALFAQPTGTYPDMIAGVHSFHFSSGGRYKLATITFGSNSAVYLGCQIALSYRIGGGNGTGSGLLGISFSEWYNGHFAKNPEGIFTLLSARSYSGVISDPITLYVRRETDYKYILYVYTSSDTEISFSLSSGEILSFEVPSTVTKITTETGDTSVVWNKPGNIRFIPVSGSWTAPNVSGDAKFTLYNSTGSSVSLTAGSLSKTLLADEYCDLLAVNGTWKKFSNSYT